MASRASTFQLGLAFCWLPRCGWQKPTFGMHSSIQRLRCTPLLLMELFSLFPFSPMLHALTSLSLLPNLNLPCGCTHAPKSHRTFLDFLSQCPRHVLSCV